MSFKKEALAPLEDGFIDKGDIDMDSVSSSNLEAIGYNEEEEVLQVEFSNGTIYQYSNVPEEVYEGLMSASSKGSYFHYEVKIGGYDFKRVS